ncbi:uncharacterized protein LOC122277317 [Carya illinoinensis]|uniref:DUF599 domain-containing protein n=1 Tax=Carya illinoinensis TaxID=32201 RepID=A0A8T1PPB9_CARIL|nr:uncharacterized protein LOC122277317 [Carya illinoinensis]KAG6643583.1 hypothetical protein CIPAW_09G222000 [Carya illinoinensis]KAG6697922.1 hypothetical protein I3842_09G225700 [Carya illinoinensis]
MGVMVYLDTILVPLSLFFTLGYHAYLWHSFKNKPCNTTIGINTLTRRAWFQDITQGDNKKGMLAVQSLRNTIMATTLTASIAILVNMALAALVNNAFKASGHLLTNPIFGSQSGRIVVVKFGSASLLLLVSFLCSSMSIGYLIDANILINACGEFSSPGHTQTIFERGFMLALIGNRVLYITFPLMLWLLGPVLVALSSVALIWVLYELDFSGKLTN